MDGTDLHLTPDERRALQALPRERQPSPLLEERTVRALRERGLIRGPGRVWPAARLGRMATAAAAALLLFVSGVAVGQRLGAPPSTAAAAVAVPLEMQSAVQVQRAGTAYVSALGSMIEAMAAADPEQRARAAEVAVAPLRAAATQIAHFAPHDPVAARILENVQDLEDARAGEDVPARYVVWF